MAGETPSCLVKYSLETRSHDQTIVTNATIDASGAVVASDWKTHKRTVTETTTLYKGTEDAVEAAMQEDAQPGAYRQKRRVAGPWWEGTLTNVTRSEWETVVNSSQPSGDSSPTVTV